MANSTCPRCSREQSTSPCVGGKGGGVVTVTIATVAHLLNELHLNGCEVRGQEREEGGEGRGQEEPGTHLTVEQGEVVHRHPDSRLLGTRQQFI